jgi:hypothetical protein
LLICSLHRKRKRGKEVVCTTEDNPAKNTRSKRPIRLKKIRRILDLYYFYVRFIKAFNLIISEIYCSVVMPPSSIFYLIHALSTESALQYNRCCSDVLVFLPQATCVQAHYAKPCNSQCAGTRDSYRFFKRLPSLL